MLDLKEEREEGMIKMMSDYLSCTLFFLKNTEAVKQHIKIIFISPPKTVTMTTNLFKHIIVCQIPGKAKK